VEIKVTKNSQDLYCDIGQHAGMVKIDRHISAYLTEEEYRQFVREGFQITIGKEKRNVAGEGNPGKRSGPARGGSAGRESGG
jgi:hypothetical protein